MNRLTMYVEKHVYYSENGNPILPVEMLETPLVRKVLKKLAEYEDIGTIEEFGELKDKNCRLDKRMDKLEDEINILRSNANMF